MRSDSSSDGEFSEFVLDPADGGNPLDASISSVPSNKRGRKKIPEKWTRVMHIDANYSDRPREHVLATDILLSQGLPALSRSIEIRHWSLLFFPKDFVITHPSMLIEDNHLSADKLKKLGIQVSKARKVMLDNAIRCENILVSRLHLELDSIVRLAKKADKLYYGKNARDKKLEDNDFSVATPVMAMRRLKYRAKVSLDEKMEIIARSLIDKQTHAQIAQEFRISSKLVSKFVTKMRNNPSMLTELSQKREAEEEKRAVIKQFIIDKNDRDEFIESAHQIKLKIWESL